jgi:hypothetical protein
MYAALAGVLLLLGLAVVWAVWDLGRRFLVTKERAAEAALIRTNEKWGDLQSTLNLRVRELNDRIDALLDGFIMQHETRLGDVESRSTEAPDFSKHNAAVMNLAAQLKELDAYMRAELDKLRTKQAGAVAAPSRRFNT